jgi:hypothetical protein
MIYDDFTVAGWPSPRWVQWRAPTYDMWDPAAKVICPGAPAKTLTIDLPRFTVSHPNHVKALMMSSETMDVPERFIARVEMAVTIFGTEPNPWALPPGDVRLAAGAMVNMDPDSGMIFDFFVSNDRIVPLYERLPFAREAKGSYPAYSILSPQPAPTRAGAWHAYEVRYDGAHDHGEWWVDGRRIWQQDRVGAAVGRTAPIVKIRHLRTGGGLFTLLDDLRNDRDKADDHPAIPGFIPSNLQDRFGQGGTVSFRNFAVET